MKWLSRARFIGILICATGLFLLFKLYIAYFTGDDIACYRVKADSLPDISDINIPKGRSVFFHETSCNSFINNKITISPRQACAVESAAYMNPALNVYLLYTSPGIIKDEGTLSDRILRALRDYKNLNILHVDYEEYSKNTPVEKLYSSYALESSRYSHSHASDILRYLTLWKYGGIYLDLDVVVIKPLSELAPNCAGAESERNVAAGVMSFEATGKGHEFAQQCLEDLRDNFSTTEWGYNGPGVITRLLQKICDAKEAKDMVGKKCQGFTVYPPEAFYVVPWWDWKVFFAPEFNTNITHITKNSYVIHVWNMHSIDTKIDLTSNVPYTLFAKQYCPKVFAECDEFF